MKRCRLKRYNFKIRNKMSEHKISKWQDEDGSDFIADVSSSNIAKRKGVLMVSRQLIMEADLNTLKVIFSNFIPIDADRNHSINYWDSIKYYGISEHFEEVEEACIAPSYEMMLTRNEKGVVRFEKMVKL
jgi:hypothetical protein